jgi:SAM-dependent methyltransferase
VAQEVTPEVEHRSGRLDAPFLESSSAVLDAMFAYALPTKDDYIIDLGSGDGRINIHAARKFGTSGHGVDLNEGLVAIANARARRAGVANRAKFYVRDLFKENLSKATIVTMYLLQDVVLRLRPKLLAELRPGARIVSHDYHMGDWRFDAARVVKSGESIVYYWAVPAKVAGTWRWQIELPEQPRDLLDSTGTIDFTGTINQRYQDIDGRVNLGRRWTRFHHAKLMGAKISISVTGVMSDRIVRHDYAGTVDGSRITGTVRLSGGVEPVTLPWSAVRSRAEN